MRNIGDKVVYGASGVMEIVDIRDETVLGESRKYYVLKELLSGSSSMTYVPVDNEELVSTMRPLLSRDEIIAIIREVKAAPPKEWIDDNRLRSQQAEDIV